jgi:hypothetical protein
MTPYRIDIASLLQASNSQQTPPSDPLRALLPGTPINVEIAIDPQTGAVGIKFNGTFYSANGLDKAKLGQLLKVIVQNNNDQILLKILDQTQSTDTSKVLDKNYLPKVSNNLTVQEKTLLREVFFPKQAQQLIPNLSQSQSVPLDSKKNIPQQVLQQTDLKISTQSAPNNLASKIQILQIEKEHTAVNSEVKIKSQIPTIKADFVKSEQKQEVPNIKQIDTPKNQFSNTPIDSAIKQPFKLESKIAQSEQVDKQQIDKQQLKSVTKLILNQLIPQIITLSRSSYKTEEELFIAVKNIIQQQKFSILDLIGSKDRSVKEAAIVNDFKKVTIEEPINSQVAKGNLNTPNLKTPKKDSSDLNVQVHNKQFVQIIQSAITNLANTTNILQRMYIDSPLKKDGILLLLPLYIGGVLRHAESYFKFDQDTQDQNPKKKKPILYKIKLNIPLLGDIEVDVLTHGSDVQLVMSVESYETKQKLEESLGDITSLFLSNGVRVVSIKVNVAASANIIPSWITDQLGCAQIA